jgi:hypothetical protein
MDAKKISYAKGYLYSINIDVKEEELLDWDSYLNDSDSYELVVMMLHYPEMAEFEKMYNGMAHDWGTNIGALEGVHLYEALSEFLGSDKDASLKLLEYGIKGIRYLDQMSRGTSGRQRTRNYVIFDDSLVHVGAVTSDKDQMLMDFR